MDVAAFAGAIFCRRVPRRVRRFGSFQHLGLFEPLRQGGHCQCRLYCTHGSPVLPTGSVTEFSDFSPHGSTRPQFRVQPARSSHDRCTAAELGTTTILIEYSSLTVQSVVPVPLPLPVGTAVAVKQHFINRFHSSIFYRDSVPRKKQNTRRQGIQLGSSSTCIPCTAGFFCAGGSVMNSAGGALVLSTPRPYCSRIGSMFSNYRLRAKEINVIHGRDFLTRSLFVIFFVCLFFKTGSGSTNRMTTLLPQVSSPWSMAADPVSGNLFIFENSIIRQISMASQTISTLAGAFYTGIATPTLTNGVGTNAAFGYSSYIAVSSTGHVYVSDSNFFRLRQVVISTQVVTTLAGDGISERKDGVGTNARFSSLGHIAADSSGNLYVQDGSFIRKIVIASGSVTTLGTVSSTSTSMPFIGLYIGPQGSGSRLLYLLFSGGVTIMNADSGNLDQTFMNSVISVDSMYGSSTMDSNGKVFVTVREATGVPKCRIVQYDMYQPPLAATFLVGSATTECSSVDGAGADIRVALISSSGSGSPPRMTADSANGVLYFWEPFSSRIRALQASAPCSAGSYCPPGSRTVNEGGLCPAGYYCPQGSDRVVCPPGKYCLAGTPSAAQALPCSAGSYCPNGSSILNQGGTCPAGFFCAFGVAHEACSAGQYCSAGSSIRNQGGACAAGYYCPSGRERVACVGSFCSGGNRDDTNLCTAGYACPGGGVIRQLCGIGTYAIEGKSACTQCPRGLVGNSTGAFCLSTFLPH
jgi:hypothetical protein